MKKDIISFLKTAVISTVAVSIITEPLAALPGTAVIENNNAVRGEDMCIAILDRGFEFAHESLILTDKNPKLSKEKADKLFKATSAYKELAVNGEERLKPLLKKSKPLSVYVNEKIPFAYDYGDNDTDLSGDYAAQGMAMMSIAAGTDTLYSGTSAISGGAAPEAQIFAMKVYSDEMGAVSGEAMTAAVNDAVTMGADVIYIAVNEVCGFEQKDWDGFDEALDNAFDNGVIVISAAGNVTEYGKGSIYEKYGIVNYVSTDSPDVGTVAYPSTNPKVISVGSVDRYEIISDFLTLSNGECVPYSDSNFMYEICGVKKSFAEHLYGKELEYVICEGVGTAEDLKKSGDLRGKVVVVNRGEITFAEKAKNAAARGAAAVIISDDDAIQYGALETMMDLTDAPIPTILIETDDYEKMVTSEIKTFRTNIGESYLTPINKTPIVSAFSPSGTTPELGLKPDVLAVGNMVKCATVSGGYGYMSSTTAAGAKAAGICACIKSHLIKSDVELTQNELADRVRRLLVNSAVLLDDMSYSEPYSPRKQGGGFVSLENAINTELILTTNGNFKAELGDGHGRIIEFDVTVENLSDTSKTCFIDCIVGMDGYRTLTYSEIDADSEGKHLWERLGESPEGEVSFITGYKPSKNTVMYIDGEACQINARAENYHPYSFTLIGGESRNFRVKLELDEKVYKTYCNVFENGFFVEGFFRLHSEDSVSSVPFVSFCGDFGAAECFDADIYSGKDGIYDNCYLYYYPSDGGSDMRILGELPKDVDVIYDKSAMTFSPTANPKSTIGINLVLLRNLKELTVTVTSAEGEILSFQKHENVARNHINPSTGGALQPSYLIWNGRAADNHGYIYEDGIYTVTVTYKRVASDTERSFTYSIFIDNISPTVEEPRFEVKDDVTLMRINVEDNQRLLSVTVFDSRYKEAELLADGCYDISALSGEYIYVEAVDTAGNKSVIRTQNPYHS